MTFQIITLGCKVNCYESEMMKEHLISAGYQEKEDHADITIINTCSVTNMADKKSQKLVRHAKRENENSILIVAGCSSENLKDVYQSMNVDILLGNKDKSKIVSFIEEYLKNEKQIINFSNTRNLPFEKMEVKNFQSHTRAFIKIQDGCNNFCSYCIIPYVRGTLRSKRIEDVLTEVTHLVENGHKEIVLTGINTGTYGIEYDYDLSDLLFQLNKIDGLERIRISSIEITELNDKFLKELKNNQKICNHLHIPLQAGSDEILKKMNRKYDLNYFKEKIKQIRNIRPDISITTDVIVGHPYETEDLFLQTLHTVKDLSFSKIHAFPYSKRDGTAAARMPEQVDEMTKKRRNKELILASLELEEAYAKKFLGKTLDVLIEEEYPDYSIGHTSNYLKVKILKPLAKNKIYSIFIMQYESDCLLGNLAEDHVLS